MKKITMEKFKTFKIENKDFVFPQNLSTKEKDIFMYIFHLLRQKINRGIYPELYNNEIIYSKSDVKNLILKGIIIFMQYKKGWIITLNPIYITKNVECSWCGAKFNEKIYFRMKRMRCPSCMCGMNGSTVTEKFENEDIFFTRKIENKTEIEKVTNDIEIVQTGIQKIIQASKEKIIPFQSSKADKLNAISELCRIAEKKKQKRAIIAQEKILANFSDVCVNFVNEYFCIYDHRIFSAMKYMNIGLTEIRKDPRFIANASLKNNVLSEVKTACELLSRNADIGMLSIHHPPNEDVTALKLPQNHS